MAALIRTEQIFWVQMELCNNLVAPIIHNNLELSLLYQVVSQHKEEVNLLKMARNKYQSMEAWVASNSHRLNLHQIMDSNPHNLMTNLPLDNRVLLNKTLVVMENTWIVIRLVRLATIAVSNALVPTQIIV